ncbi:MAG: SMC family ATPase [Thermoplasmata archaeon]|nr:MAG: SMC family ATPase [Thermoplasmata archaeon]
MKTLEDFITEDSTSTEYLEEQIPKTKIVAEPSQGFIIKEIEMKGFMRYIEKTTPPITFPGKFTVITGKTGSGKTSILDAITFTLYKRTSRTDIQGIKISDICRSGGYVRVSFFQSAEEYVVERGFSSSSLPYLTLKKNGKNIEGNIKELEGAIEDIVGLDYDGFRNSTFVRQEEMKELGSESGARRLNIFQKLFRLETFEKAHNLVDRRYSQIQRHIQVKEAELKVEKKHAEKLPELKDLLKRLKRERDEKKGKEDTLKKELKAKVELLEKLEKDHEEYVRIQTELKGTAKILERIEKKIEDAKKHASKFNELKKKAKELERETQKFDELREEADKLTELKNKVQRIKDRLQILKEQEKLLKKKSDENKNKLEKELKIQEKRISSLTTGLDKDEAFGLLRDEGGLKERVARISLELDWLKENQKLVKELTKEQARANSALTKLSKKVSDINADSFILSEIKDRVKSIKSRFHELEKVGLEESEKQKRGINELEKELSEIGFKDKEEKKLLNIKKELKEMHNKRGNLKNIRKKLDEIGDLSKLIEELEIQKKEKTSEKEDLKAKFQKLTETEKDYLGIKGEIEGLKKEEKKLTSDISQIVGKTSQIASQLADLEAAEQRIKDTESELEGERERAEIYDILRNQIFHKRGIVMYAIDQLLPQLSLETSTNLSDMTDGRFSKVRLNSYEENNRYGIRIEVSGADGKWHDVQEFSGGEKTQINAALRFAIAKELASMPQVGRTYGRMKTLFIDEGDLGSLDNESSRELFISKLFSMGEFFEKIILITHLSEVAEKFPGRLMVYMTPEEESKIKVMA